MSLVKESVIVILLTERQAFHRFLTAQVGDASDAEDILRDSLEKALRRADGLKRGERIVPWFYRVLRKAIADFDESTKSQERPVSVLTENCRGGNEDSEIPPRDWNEAVCRCFEGILPTLKPRYVELLTRVDLNGELKVVVRHQMKLSPAAFDVALHRARNALRKRLEIFCGAYSREACIACASEQSRRVR